MATGAAMAPIPQQNNPQTNAARLIAAARVRVAGKWFYWIAALSMINSLVVIFGGNLHFVVGLGFTSVVDALAKQAGSAGVPLDLVINAFIAGVFALLGSFAVKAQKWAFIAGMALYAADGALCLMGKDIFSVAFHGYVLFAVYRGFSQVDQAQPAGSAFGSAAINPR